MSSTRFQGLTSSSTVAGVVGESEKVDEQLIPDDMIDEYTRGDLR